MDCCYSGAHRPGGKGGDESANEAKKLIEDKSKMLGEGTCILTACKPMQKAYGYKEQGHSFFTFYLAEALGKKECVDEDGDVTPELVNRYIDLKIRRLPENMRPKQTPLLDCRTAGKIVLAHHPELAKIKVDIAQLISEGNQYLRDKKYGDAIRKFDEVLSLDKKNHIAYQLKGDALIESRKPHEALECYNKAIEIKPDFIYALRGKGLALYYLSKYNEAIEFYDKTLEIDPKDAISWNFKGVVFKDLGKYHDAIEHFDKAISLSPRYDEALNNKESCLQIQKLEMSAAEASSETGAFVHLNDVYWDDLLTLIKQGKCVPIIGNTVCSPFLPLKSQIANEWALRYRYPLKDSTDLPRVAQFLAINQGDEMFPKLVLAKQLKEISPPNFASEEFANTPYAVLADLNLPIYITTNYDHFMEAALISREKEPVREYCIWKDMLDPMSEKSRVYQPTVSKPLVFHLHGDIDIPESMVLTERDYFDFVIKLNKEDERDLFPTVIRRQLPQSSLLLIGYSSDDIDFRAIFQGALSFFQSRLRRKASIAVLTPPVGSVADQQIIHYMDNYVKNLLEVHAYWGSPTSFCYELKKKWEKFQRQR